MVRIIRLPEKEEVLEALETHIRFRNGEQVVFVTRALSAFGINGEKDRDIFNEIAEPVVSGAPRRKGTQRVVAFSDVMKRYDELRNSENLKDAD